MYHLDYETTSGVDTKRGAWRYAADPDARILMFAIAKEDKDPLLWVHPDYRIEDDPQYDLALDLYWAMLQSDEVIWAHNVEFERAMTHYRAELDLGVALPGCMVSRWRCTKALCLRANIEPSLEKAAVRLNLVDKKDSAGKRLINLFSVKRTPPSEKPEKWKQFCDYCLQDVRTEQALHRKLKFFEPEGVELQTFLLDGAMNQRGIPVDVGVLRSAQAVVDEVTGEATMKFRSLTGLNPTQTVRITEQLGLPNMQASTLKGITDHPQQEAINLLQTINFAAVKKIAAMLNCTCPDGVVRGGHQYYGASNTGRWSGRLIQPQNFRKPSIPPHSLEPAYQAIKGGANAEELGLIYGEPLEVIASVVRLFIRQGGHTMLDADYAGIEARVVNWLAGQQDALERFREGADQYVLMAEKIGHGASRQLGKAAVLGCGFGMGAPKFQATVATWGMDISEELSQAAVTAYRTLHDKVVEFWKDCDSAAKRALRIKGKWHKAGKVAFGCRVEAGMEILFCRLPSGRMLSYPEPKLGEGKFGTEITYFGKMQGKANFSRVKLYGGKLAENLTQAVAADIMAHGLINAQERGFDVFMLVHDQAVAIKKEGQTPEQFAQALTQLPEWAEGLPLTAEANEVISYNKD